MNHADQIHAAIAEATVPSSGPDLRWAHRIMARKAHGEPVSYIALKWAKEALAKQERLQQPDHAPQGAHP